MQIAKYEAENEKAVILNQIRKATYVANCAL